MIHECPLPRLKKRYVLVEDGVNHEGDLEINFNEAIVEGFRDGTTLLLHQGLARAWVRERVG
jgi:hypothetical protein